MKRFLALILAALMLLLTLAACSSNGGNKVPQPDNDQNQTNEPSKDDPTNNTEYRVQELVGYSFTFDGGVIEKSVADGLIAETDDYSLIVYYYNDITFDVWDNVTDMAFKRVKDAMYEAFRFYPTEQTNSTSTKIENNYGETVLKVSGTMKGDQTGEGTMNRQFIAFYYVTDENVVRFCVGVPKDDSSASYAALDAAMDTLIENLKKAA